jgi:hypothetical protein
VIFYGLRLADHIKFLVKKEYEVKANNMIKLTKGVLYTILALFLVGAMINCGGGSSATPAAKVEAPQSLIKDFIAKHKTMVDLSLVDLYAKDERPRIAAEINKTIDEMKSTGELDKLMNATFDFSNLQIKVVGQKEGYIDDRPRKLMKVALSGSYVMKEADESKTIPANESIVLEMVNNSWKVTESVDPFKKYQYNKS